MSIYIQQEQAQDNMVILTHIIQVLKLQQLKNTAMIQPDGILTGESWQFQMIQQIILLSPRVTFSGGGVTAYADIAKGFCKSYRRKNFPKLEYGIPEQVIAELQHLHLQIPITLTMHLHVQEQVTECLDNPT